MLVALPILLLSLGTGVIVALALASKDRPVPDHQPDLPPNAQPPVGFPRSTGYRLVDKILPLLKQASDSSGIPLGVLVGWIAKESGGKIGETTRYGELGLFQLMPDEQKKVGFTDTDRLSTNYTYSINAGLALIGAYKGVVDKLGIAQSGSEYYWKLVKLCHSMGSGAVQKVISAAGNDTRTWSRLEDYAESHEDELKSATGHSPTKWFKFVDAVANVGQPFGFGSQDAIVGEVFPDIIDPLDVMDRINANTGLSTFV